VKPGRPVIALVEDEPLLRVPLAKSLDDASFNVMAAANGTDGLDLLEDPTVDLAVVDVRLPGRLDGISLVREAKRRNPRLKAIFISGRPPATDVSDLGPFLPKPFQFGELMALVAQLMGDRD
jgi:two-component system cell cycle sensor histidine kinase/response regulator CckA